MDNIHGRYSKELNWLIFKVTQDSLLPFLHRVNIDHIAKAELSRTGMTKKGAGNCVICV